MVKEHSTHFIGNLKRYLGAKIRPAPGWYRKSPGVFDVRFLASLGLLTISLLGLAITSFLLLKSAHVADNTLNWHMGLMIFAFFTGHLHALHDPAVSVDPTDPCPQLGTAYPIG
jgi:hypothetical protein